MRDFDRAKLIYEQAMEDVYDKVDKAIEYVLKLNELVDEQLDEDVKGRAEELINSALTRLEEID